MQEQELPEEKLLKIIRNKDLDNKIEVKTGKGIESIISLFTKASFLFRSRILLLLFSLFFVVFAVLLVREMIIPVDSTGYSNEDAQKQTNSDLKQESEDVKLDIYLSEIEKKDIFNIGRMTSSGASVEQVSLKNIVLVGVITEEPVQAIIKDKLSDSTSFLQTGEYFKGFLIKEIHEGVVILDSNGELFELRM